MFQIKLREHPALESGCRVSGAVEGVYIRAFVERWHL